MSMNSRPTPGLTSDIAEALEHAVAVVVGEGQLVRRRSPHEARRAALEGAVGLPLSVGRRQEEEMRSR